jgi:DNA-binding PadR family transcriptional regulator
MDPQWKFGARRHHKDAGHFAWRAGLRIDRSIGGGRAFRIPRVLASGDFPLIVLALLSEKPRHGYGIIKAVGELSSRAYIPSSASIYPALTYLVEMGYATTESQGRKTLYTITDAGKEHLEKNRSSAHGTLEQLSRFGEKVAKMQKHFTDEETENDFDQDDPRMQENAELRKLRIVFSELKHELKTALREKLDAPDEEKDRMVRILRRAIREIRRE